MEQEERERKKSAACPQLEWSGWPKYGPHLYTVLGQHKLQNFFRLCIVWCISLKVFQCIFVVNSLCNSLLSMVFERNSIGLKGPTHELGGQLDRKGPWRMPNTTSTNLTTRTMKSSRLILNAIQLHFTCSLFMERGILRSWWGNPKGIQGGCFSEEFQLLEAWGVGKTLKEKRILVLETPLFL